MMSDRALGLTFAGGGNRAFYHTGWLDYWGPRLWPHVAAVSACSAGACAALMHLAGREDESFDFWVRRRQHVVRNFEWSRLLRGQRPTPQYPVYRDTLFHMLDSGGFDRIKALPFPIFVTCAALPRFLPGALAALVGIAAYSLEKKLRPSRLHPTYGRRIGFSPWMLDARTCASAEELVALVLASSATPPFTPVGVFRGRPLLDGGLVDNAPAYVLENLPIVRHTMVLMTRPRPAELLRGHAHRTYIAPRQPVEVGRWDYTRPDLLSEAVEQGRREAADFTSVIDRALADSGRAG
jgi:predicted acylesterase/phospholipase RssA